MSKEKKLAVVVGRFQTHELHMGYRHCIGYAEAHSDDLLIVIGVTGGWSSGHDPLDFATRSLMLMSVFPTAVVREITDCSTNEYWSEKLDMIIRSEFPEHEVTLYGSRDSFLSAYVGAYKTVLVPECSSHSGTEVRQNVAREVLDSKDFRAGMIYASTTQNFSTSFQAVDIVVRHTLEPKVLVGRRTGEVKWRLPGGFVDPSDQSLERAVKREALEELGDIEIDDVKYITSLRIDDPRYRKSQHKVMSALFSALYIFGRISAEDDLDEVRWQDIDGLVDCLTAEHKPLGEAYLKSLRQN